MLPVLLGAGTHTSYNISVGFLRCLSLSSGQCEGLETWDERQVQFPRFFILCGYLIL